MKRLSTFILMLMAYSAIFAQQALWGTQPTVSPQVNNDNTVTFRLKAPKAVKVQVTGDFLPTQEIPTE